MLMGKKVSGCDGTEDKHDTSSLLSSETISSS